MINTLIFQVSNRTSKKCAYNHLPEVPSDIEPQLSKLMTFSLIRPVVAVLYFLSHVSTSQVALMVKKPACQCRRHKRCGFDPWVGKTSWAWQPTPVFLPGEYHGQRNLAGYSSWGCRESDMTEATTSLVMLPVITIIRNIMGSNSCPRSDNGEPSLRLCAME